MNKHKVAVSTDIAFICFLFFCFILALNNAFAIYKFFIFGKQLRLSPHFSSLAIMRRTQSDSNILQWNFTGATIWNKIKHLSLSFSFWFDCHLFVLTMPKTGHMLTYDWRARCMIINWISCNIDIFRFYQQNNNWIVMRKYQCTPA